MANATGTQMAMAPREEDLQDLEELQRDMQGRVDKAREDGRIYMMQEYVRILALVTPEIKRIRIRFDRETLAGMRKDHRNLKAQAKAEKLASEEAAAANVRNQATQ